MSRSQDRRKVRPYSVRKLMGQFFAQRLPEEHWEAMVGCQAITFRPGNFGTSFVDRVILPAGTAIQFRVGYELNQQGDRARIAIPVAGFHGQTRWDGSVEYGAGQAAVHVNLAIRPKVGARRTVIDPEHNPSLLEVALQLDKHCQRAVLEGRSIAAQPTLPKVLLSFPNDKLPVFQDTPYLRELAARKVGVPVSALGSNGELLLDRLLRDTWDEASVLSTDAYNWTGTTLMDARLCPNAREFLRIYEDFRDLLGVYVWNPVRGLQIEQLVNPAFRVLDQHGLLGAGNLFDTNQPLTEGVVESLLQGMRSTLGDVSAVLTDEDLLDGITNPPIRFSRHGVG